MQPLDPAFSDPSLCRGLLDRIEAELDVPLRFMEVCGTHTTAIFRAGLPSLWSSRLTHISGPGCPVCVTHGQEIASCLEIAGKEGVILASFGDLMRIPGPKGMSLGRARAEGADVRIIYSPLEALELAVQNPKHAVVFLGVGFETTAPATAVAIRAARQAKLENFSVLSLHKLTPPALRVLLRDEAQESAQADAALAIDAFLLPGHVSTILGPEPFRFIADEYGKPGVIGGFEPADILQSLLLLIRMRREGRAQIGNQYSRAVGADGNAKARALMDEVFTAADTAWRGLGLIPQSGLEIRAAYADFDARKRFSLDCAKPASALENPACKCGEVLRGRISPRQCPLFAKVCVPERPAGPCMVSSEGSCAAFFRYQTDF